MEFISSNPSTTIQHTTTNNTNTNTNNTITNTTNASPRKLEVGRTILPRGHSLHLGSNKSSTASSTSSSSSSTIDSVVSSGSLTTESIDASDMLSKLSNFLPQMLAANVELEATIAENPDVNVAIDYISDDEKPYIEMEIAKVALSDDEEEIDSKSNQGSKGVVLLPDRLNSGVGYGDRTGSSSTSSSSSNQQKTTQPKKKAGLIEMLE